MGLGHVGVVLLHPSVFMALISNKQPLTLLKSKSDCINTENQSKLTKFDPVASERDMSYVQYIYMDGFYENVSNVSIIKNRVNTNNSQHIYYLKL